MKYAFFIPFCLVTGLLQAQQDGTATPRRAATVKYQSPLDANLELRQMRIDQFTLYLDLLKKAYSDQDVKKLNTCQRQLLEIMRTEVFELEEKTAGDKIQAERRLQNGNGEATPGGEAPRPKRDLLAEPQTPSEKRLESMRLIMASFERHGYDFSKPQDAERDFNKMADFLRYMQMELTELRELRN